MVLQTAQVKKWARGLRFMPRPATAADVQARLIENERH